MNRMADELLGKRDKLFEEADTVEKKEVKEKKTRRKRKGLDEAKKAMSPEKLSKQLQADLFEEILSWADVLEEDGTSDILNDFVDSVGRDRALKLAKDKKFLSAFPSRKVAREIAKAIQNYVKWSEEDDEDDWDDMDESKKEA